MKPSRPQRLTQSQLEARSQAFADNVRRLHSCGLHAFKLIERTKGSSKRYKCAHCGGVVDATARMWYERGVQHGHDRYSGTKTKGTKPPPTPPTTGGRIVPFGA